MTRVVSYSSKGRHAGYQTVDKKREIEHIIPLMTAADYCDRNGREFGDKEALIDDRRRLTWREVKDLSDRLALGLIRLRLKREGRLLVQLPNSAELFLTRLAAEKAGLRLITVTPTFRRAELEAIVKFTRPEAAIISWRHRGFDYHELLNGVRTPELRQLLVAGEEVPSGALSLEEILAYPPSPDTSLAKLAENRHSITDICQLATTSGSTGIPKCVEVPLYTRLLTAWSHIRRFCIESSDTLAALTPIVTGTADALVYNGGCAMGARIVLLDHFSPEGSLGVLAKERVNVVPLVPTMMARILAVRNLSSFDLASLRVVINHGANLPYAQGSGFERRLGCRIMQGFGSVDCGGVSATSWNDPEEIRLGTVGAPLEGNEIRIVDEQEKGVTPGEVGRLWVRGLHTEACFFNNPELNARRRRDGFFDLEELARQDGNGNLILMGREQEVIIRGGQNIYPVDVEAALVQHPKVLEAAAIGIPDVEMGERVCAYVVCRKGESLSLAEVRAFLEEKGLARFKWPERIELVQSLPKVASGHKIDKKKLKEL